MVNTRRVKAGRLQQDRTGSSGHFTTGSAHYPGNGYGSFLIGNNQHVTGERPLHVIQGCDNFTGIRPAHDDFLPPEPLIVKGMEGLAVFQHNVIGNINNIIYGAYSV